MSTITERRAPELDDAAVAATHANPHHEKRWAVLIVLCIAQLMVVLDATIVNIALPSAQSDLGFSDDKRQWIVTAYALAFGSLLLIGGRISDMFGRKWTFVGGLLGFGAASAVGGAAQSFEVLVGARAGQGVFGALLAPAALSLLTTTFHDGAERQKAFGIYGAIAGGGGAIGLLLGGVLTDSLSWRWCLYVNLALAIPAAFAGFVLLHNQRAPIRPKFDVPGALTVTLGLFALVYGVSHAETTSWSNTTTLASIVVGVALVAAFLAIEQRVKQPLLPLHVLRDRDRFASFTAVGMVSMAIFGVFLFLTYYLQQTLGYSPVKTGLAFMPMSVGIVAMALVGGQYLVPRVGRKITTAVAMVISAAGMVLLTGIDVDSSYLEHVAPGLLLVGLGAGMVFGGAFAGATVGVGDEESGVASATVNTFQQIGGSFGTALLSTFFATAVSNSLEDNGPGRAAARLAEVDGYVTVFWWSAAIFVTGAVITGLLYRPGKPAQSEGGGPVIAH